MPTRDWNPKNTKVVILGLGLNDWDDPDDPIGHRDLVLHKFFKKAGVPDKNNVHIRDAKGDYDSIWNFLPDFLADSDEDTFFIFYYAGHGDLVEDSEWDYDLYFCHPDENKDSFTLGDLMTAIEENFNGYNVLMLADCCYSGNIARLAAEYETDFYLAGLTSALSTILSTGSWTFTDCVLEALNGKAHIDKDDSGTISIKELAAYVKKQMRDVEEQKSDFGYGPEFDVEMCLAVVK